VQAGAPVALSSDAHSPKQVGADYDQALALLARLGVQQLCVFERRVRRLVPLGAAARASHGAEEREAPARAPANAGSGEPR
jgi:hypothetical protein